MRFQILSKITKLYAGYTPASEQNDKNLESSVSSTRRCMAVRYRLPTPKKFLWPTPLALRPGER